MHPGGVASLRHRHPQLTVRSKRNKSCIKVSQKIWVGDGDLNDAETRNALQELVNMIVQKQKKEMEADINESFEQLAADLRKLIRTENARGPRPRGSVAHQLHRRHLMTTTAPRPATPPATVTMISAPATLVPATATPSKATMISATATPVPATATSLPASREAGDRVCDLYPFCDHCLANGRCWPNGSGRCLANGCCCDRDGGTGDGKHDGGNYDCFAEPISPSPKLSPRRSRSPHRPPASVS